MIKFVAMIFSLIVCVDGKPHIRSSSSESDKCWMFMHLQKSGGSTVKTIINDTWKSKSNLYDSVQWKYGESFNKGYSNNIPYKWNVIEGGYVESLRGVVTEKNCKWFTVFRDPVSRLVSAYEYCKKASKDQTCASNVHNARDLDIVSFAKHWGNYALRQFVLNMVSWDTVIDHLTSESGRNLTQEYISESSGWYLMKLYLEDIGGDSGEALSDFLQPVKDLLDTEYSAVGILEKFDETLTLFNEALDMPSMDWHEKFEEDGKKNVHHTSVTDIMREAMDSSEIMEYLRLDILLYEHAVEVFNRQAVWYGIE